MDKVFIQGLEIETLIGIYDWEREIRQPLVFDVTMAYDNRVPGNSGALGDAIDYEAVVNDLRAFVEARDDGLLETLAEAACERLLARFRFDAITLRIDKPGAARLLGCAGVGIEIHRRRAG